ncbi:uncharacterized protein LOC5521519 [Nematostella vectensis]|uniref:uncharacterized protein LOC5521519 n=1 Tax=Nematostella vectensis TaxID=45351 RepID=UPI00207786BB|nr:uncharacterized protein LOC5521519 [Nematostella vectensis]
MTEQTRSASSSVWSIPYMKAISPFNGYQNPTSKSNDHKIIPDSPTNAGRFRGKTFPSFGGPNSHVSPHSLRVRSCGCAACVASASYPYTPFLVPRELKDSPNQAYYPVKEIENASKNLLPPGMQDASPNETCDVTDSSSSARRGRTVFSAQQLQVLERVFAGSQYIVGSQRKFLASQLRLSETQY